MLSIIIPAFNEEKYIGNCLKSLQRQSSKRKFEVIVVDNNSTDKTVTVAKKFSQAFPLRIVTEKRNGVSFARNTGAKTAKGDLLAFLDADNVVTRGYVESMYCSYEQGFVAATIRTINLEKSLRGSLIFTILELIKLYGPQPFGKSFCRKEIFLQ